MKHQMSEELGQDLGKSKIQNTLDEMVCPNKTIFTKKVRYLTSLPSTLAMKLNVLAACCTLVCRVLARRISLVQHQAAIKRTSFVFSTAATASVFLVRKVAQCALIR